MSAVALGLYLAFLAVAFGLRAWVQYQCTGDHGLRGLSGGGGPIAWSGAALLLTGVVLAGAAPAAQLLGIVESPGIVDAPWSGEAGLTLALVGTAVTVVSQHQMGASWRVGVDAGEKTSLITVGLFGLVRNPVFTGMVLAAAGLLLMVPNFISAAAFTSLLAGVEIQVRCVEEPYLARLHGARYLSYARAVGRFLPWVGRLA